MGPIPGLSWADVLGVVAAFAVAASLLGIQWYQADVVAPAGRARRAARTVLIALLIPFLIISLYQAWLAPPDSIRVGALILWLGGNGTHALVNGRHSRVVVDESTAAFAVRWANTERAIAGEPSQRSRPGFDRCGGLSQRR